MTDAKQADNARRLIEQLEAEAAVERAEILKKAEAEARAITDAARAESRQKLRAAVRELRRTGSLQVSRMKSAIETERRHLRQKRGLAAQERGLSRLCAAMERLWEDDKARAIWCARLLDEAKAHLLHPDWIVEHPRNWSADERARFLAQVQAHTGLTPGARVNENASAGLVIESGTARIDGTSRTLCRDTPRLRALFQSALRAMENKANA